MRERIELSDEWRYAQLATLIESWGYRAVARARAAAAAARAGAAVVPRGVRADGRRCCARPGIGGGGTETERYLRVAMLRFLLLQRHDWTEDIAERLAGEVKSPSAAAEKDTMTHQIIKEMRD